MIIDSEELALLYANQMVPNLHPARAELLSGGYCNHVFRIHCDRSLAELEKQEQQIQREALESVILKVCIAILGGGTLTIVDSLITINHQLQKIYIYCIPYCNLCSFPHYDPKCFIYLTCRPSHHSWPAIPITIFLRPGL